MMKVIIAIAFIASVVSAQRFCVSLLQDDTTCVGHRSKWPTNVCSGTASNVSSAATCDSAAFFDSWKSLCSLKNTDNVGFCEGTGFLYAETMPTSFCGFGWSECATDADCNLPAPPTSSATPAPLCASCCSFCFNSTDCSAKTDTAPSDPYTANSTCTSCTVVVPQAPTASNTPTTGNKPVAAPKASSAVVVVVSGTILAFVAALF